MSYDATGYADDIGALCRALLGRYLRRYWYRAVQGGGTLGDLFVTVEDVTEALRPPLPLPEPEDLELRIAAGREHLRAATAANAELPVARLQAETGLDPEAVELVSVLATLQASPGLLRACTFAWADFSVKQPTAGFMVELLADDVGHAARLWSATAADAPARRLRLLELGEDRRWQPSTPLLQRPAFVPDSVVRFLTGQPVSGETYPNGAVRLEDDGPRPDELVLDDARRVGRLLDDAADRDGGPVLLIGAPGAGRRTLARAHALGRGRPLWVVDIGALPWELEPFEAQLGAALRDGVLAGAVPFLRCETLEDRTDRRPPVLGRLVRALDVPVVLSARPANVPFLTAVLPELRVATVGDGSVGVRTRLYTRLLRQNGFDVPERRLASMVDGYRLRPGDLERALKDVRVTAGGTAELDAADFDRAVRRQVRTNLSDLASPITTTQRWEDLVVSEEQRELIDEILTHARHKTLVFEDWGFGRKLGSRGQGLSCLFSGPPGTGKTMTATLIAQELDLDLYQVDLSRIVDKYVGETEKNLARLFDEASRVPVVLLFDEADSLFATRTKVESSNDRYANLEVNYLLQRMETYEGISILTTNLGSGIDSAFKRRLRFRLHFDMPGPDEREILWRRMVPPGCELDPGVDFAVLARKWEMSGAIIRNAMVRAAFLAAAGDGRLTQQMLTRAARSELIELGRLGS